MTLGRMMDYPLSLTHLLERANRYFPRVEVVTRGCDGTLQRQTWGDVYRRSCQLAHALARLGVKPGDRVATLAWNSGRHMEAWYAIMGVGAVCHTLNPRLFPDQLCYIIGHAEDKVLFTDLTFLPTIIERPLRVHPFDMAASRSGQQTARITRRH